jgi:hypothetical protein
MKRNVLKDPLSTDVMSNSFELRPKMYVIPDVPKIRTLKVEPSLHHFKTREKEFLEKNVRSFVGVIVRDPPEVVQNNSPAQSPLKMSPDKTFMAKTSRQSYHF